MSSISALIWILAWKSRSKNQNKLRVLRGVLRAKKLQERDASVFARLDYCQAKTQ